MSNNDYWQKRGEFTQKRLMSKADNFVEDMERVYKEAGESIERDISLFFQRFAKNEGMTLTEAKRLLKGNELDRFKMTVEEYIEKGREMGVSGKWIKELESASDLYRISRLKAFQTQINNQVEMLAAYKEQGLTKTLKEIFEEGYYRNIFNFQQFTGIGNSFEILDVRTINQAIMKPWTYDGATFSDRIWKDKEKLKNSLEKTLTQGIIRGESPEVIARKIAKETNVELNAARRLVVTESAAMSTRASMEGYEELGVEEIEFSAALDERTCPECGDMDGKHFPTKDGQIGLNMPPLHPHCRCTTIPYFDDEFTAGTERAARNEAGETYYVPSDMTYKQWKEKYVDTLPKDKIIKGSELKRYSEDEIKEIADTTEKIIDKYVSKKSKWSGNIIVDPSDGIYGKRWNCDISTMSETSAHIILHEQLHARSISYFDSATYIKHSYIEEGAVQLLTQEISKAEGIELVSSQYDELTDALRKINSVAALYETELEFAINLFDIAPNERLDWLEAKVYDKLFKSGTIEEMTDMNDLFDLFR